MPSWGDLRYTQHCFQSLSQNYIFSTRSIHELKQGWDMWRRFMLWLLSSKDSTRKLKNKILRLNLCSECCQGGEECLFGISYKKHISFENSSWKPYFPVEPPVLEDAFWVRLHNSIRVLKGLWSAKLASWFYLFFWPHTPHSEYR